MNFTYILIALVIGIALPQLFKIFKDLKVGPKERKVLLEIVTTTLKDLIAIGTTKSKKDLIHAATNITLRKLKENNIKSFTRDEIKNIVLILYNKIY